MTDPNDRTPAFHHLVACDTTLLDLAREMFPAADVLAFTARLPGRMYDEIVVMGSLPPGSLAIMQALLRPGGRIANRWGDHVAPAHTHPRANASEPEAGDHPSPHRDLAEAEACALLVLEAALDAHRCRDRIAAAEAILAHVRAGRAVGRPVKEGK